VLAGKGITPVHEFSRTELLIGPAALERLRRSKVAVFGIGGVGSFVVEALARSGVGQFVLVDNDIVCLSNINRQLLATHSSLDRPKVEVMRERILDINPQALVEIHQIFYLPDTAADLQLLTPDLDYLVDAIDTVSAKIDLAVRATALGIPIISSMGAGNKLDPTRFEIADIYKTSVDPLSRVMRKALRERNVPRLKVVYSREEPIHPMGEQTEDPIDLYPPSDSIETAAPAARPGKHQRRIPGSIAFVPSVVGLIIAGEVIKDLIVRPEQLP
jgi:tRNA A37 threonylcarbamoyladenosine dehydratase